MPLSLAMDDGEFNHGRGGGGGGLVATAAQLVAKVAGNKSVNGCMMACDDESGRQKTMQQPTNDRSSKGRCW